MAGLIQDIELIGQTFPELQELRLRGREAFVMPKPKDEAWHYTKLRELDADDYVMGADVTLDGGVLPLTRNLKQQVAKVSSSPARGEANVSFDCYKIHFNNGVFSPVGSVLPEDVEVYPLIEAFMMGGCTCGNADTPHQKPKGSKAAKVSSSPARGEVNSVLKCLNKNIDFVKYPFAALNTAYLQEGLFIRVEGKLDKPLVIFYNTETSSNLFYNTRNLIVLEDGAEASILEAFEYDGEVKSRYFGNHVNEIFVGRGAKLSHYKLQDEAFKASHIALSVAEVLADGKYQHFCLQKGAGLARNEVVVKLLGQKASAQVDGAYSMYGWATLDTTTLIEHLAPYTYSEQLVKGVIGGDARGVFQGKIYIAPKAVKAEGVQQHRALLLSDTAEVDAKPELEIYADDVKCSHGAASGELNEEALFYMEARGISREDAKQILIDAYLDEVIDRIEDEGVREWMRKGLVKEVRG